ncbi:HAMP domain-containing sensor histidine kinase [Nocardioides dubius]|uniref:histidine kinase n=1 Tax=Nocardioides dubius TaxID=317019 RepID=A0ABN1U390_9ACTN
MRLPSSLTARLTLTAVALVAMVSVLLGGLTTLAMRSHLTDQLDKEVTSSLQRVVRGGPPGQSPMQQPPDDFGELPRQSVGSLFAAFIDDDRFGRILGETTTDSQELDDHALDDLDDLETGRISTIDVPGHGSYRVAVVHTDQGRLMVGLPTDEVDQALSSLLWWEIILGFSATALAGVVAWLMVRRQLRPLREVAATAHEVAALPLASGEIAVHPRVDDRLTDEASEVGQVGAALNTLLSHVEESLAARHRSEQQVRQFVADASHELRTPLATIKGYAELSRRAPADTATAQAALNKVETEAARMSSLVEDLLLLARLDAGRPLESGDVDLTRLLLESVSDARVLGPEHRWQLDLPGEVVEAPGDEGRLRQVVRNLLENARRHTPAGTTVVVEARPSSRPGEPVVVTITDDGPGFGDDLLPTAFERFTRGDPARHRGTDPGGSGLGLSLVRAIVEAHGGTVALSSVPGRTRFTISLPA